MKTKQVSAEASAAARALAALRKPKNMVRGDSEYYRNLALRRNKK